MQEMEAFHDGGNWQWFKGNLHSHTTISDGMLTPQQAVALYREHQYQFLCLSEHDIYTDHRAQFNTDDFIVLPALEYSAILYNQEGSNNRQKIHHMHGILGTGEMQKQAANGLLKHMQHIEPLRRWGSWDGAKVAQEMADMLRSHGCFVTYNHPIWSRISGEEFTQTDGISLLEIYNYNTVQESNTGYDVTHWDSMLRRGQRVLGFASDDNHNEGLFDDACGGWVSVLAPALTHDDIVTNLLAGNYYFSSGPEIKGFGIRNGTAWVDCSPVNRVHFIAGGRINDGTTVHTAPMAHGQALEDGLSHADYQLTGCETYLRVECVDRYGRTAWSNPIWIDH